MPYIQFKLTELESQILEIYKAVKKLKSKKDAIKAIISEKKELLDKLKPEIK